MKVFKYLILILLTVLFSTVIIFVGSKNKFRSFVGVLIGTKIQNSSSLFFEYRVFVRLWLESFETKSISFISNSKQKWHEIFINSAVGKNSHLFIDSRRNRLCEEEQMTLNDAR